MNNFDFDSVNRLLKKEYDKHRAPIVEFIQVQTGDPFKVLVTTILSARTKDETTTEVSLRLFKKIKKLSDLDKIPVKELEKLIFPIGFFRTKARMLKQLPEAVQTLFKGRIPDEIDDLCKLPGVGRKTANLVRAVAFNKPAICVDVHVHRICNRFGLLKTKTPFDTEMALRKILPEKYWITWNAYLVSYGQTLCHPVSPHCSICVIKQFCKRIGVKKSR
jgi:endonuclease III